jgi:hypothetical protein
MKDRILLLLKNGPMRRGAIIYALGEPDHKVDAALRQLRKENKVDPTAIRGQWSLSNGRDPKETLDLVKRTIGAHMANGLPARETVQKIKELVS